jgi:conjugative relaxase-like TrwC/TraI family protein
MNVIRRSSQSIRARWLSDRSNVRRPSRYDVGECFRPQTQTNLKNAQTYFEEHLAVGDYLAEAERVVGQWIGKFAELLGLVGAVAQRDFVALCENNDLRTGTRLTQRLKTTRTVDGGTDHEHQAANRRVFYDFTFSPPKSVSIAALVNDDARIVQAHREAVRIAATELERVCGALLRCSSRKNRWKTFIPRARSSFASMRLYD